MKKLLLLFSIVLMTSTLSKNVYAQPIVSDSVSIQPGYTNQTYYNMQNGTLSSVSNTDWDLGFQIRGFSASILINSKNNVHLYKTNKDVGQWSTMTAADTTGLLTPSNELLNSDTSWDWGAFNITGDTSNAFDLGWGLYDPPTHYVIGDSLYFIKLPTGDYKKLWIEVLMNGTYYFRHADLDGSNETLDTLIKSDFANKYFGYFSIVNHTTINREPDYNAWDLVFTQYLSLTPYIYKVAGVLSNDSVQVAKAYPVDVNTITYNNSGLNYRYAINTIGYDWKVYDPGTNTWTIEDSLVYFVNDRNSNMWKVIFTGFGGSATGKYYFTKQPIPTAGVNEHQSLQLLSAYPNPASSILHLVINNISKSSDQQYQLVNMLGEVVDERMINLPAGLNSLVIPLQQLINGIYFLRIGDNKNFTTQKIVVHH